MRLRLIALRFVGPVCAVVLSYIATANADARTDFRLYDQASGLENLDGHCLLQDRTGELLACTEQGVFAYDGRSFTNLGPAQGLRLGRYIYDLVESTSGRIAVQYVDEIRVSTTSVEAGRTTSALTFKTLNLGNRSFYMASPRRLVSWHKGFALLLDNRPVEVVVPESGDPYVKSIVYTSSEQQTLGMGLALFSEQGHLWEVRTDQALCLADPGAVRCFKPIGLVRPSDWFSLQSDTGMFGKGRGSVIARSMDSIETINLLNGSVTTQRLPYQNASENDSLRGIALFTLPDGKLATQSLHGLLVREQSGWIQIPKSADIPEGAIAAALTDRSGQLWLFIQGRGLFRSVGYGRWDTLTQGVELPKGLVWSTLLRPDGALWIAADAGLLKLVHSIDGYKIDQIFPGSAYAIASDEEGRIWSSYGTLGVRLLDLDGTTKTIPTPGVNALQYTRDGRMWIGTEGGLTVTPTANPMVAPPPPPPNGEVAAMVDDGHDGIFYAVRGRLRHRMSDGQDVPVKGLWPTGSFEPLCMVGDKDNELWIAGGGGLYRLRVVANTVLSFVKAPRVGDTGASIVAVTIDRRGWLWAADGTAVWVFNGRSWVALSTEDGLISDDVTQNGLDAAADGSIWISTTAGLSHLRAPSSVFSNPPLAPPSITAVFSGHILRDHAKLPYSPDPLSVDFGTTDFGSEQSIVFRYKLSGIDRDFSVSPSGMVRYPTLTAGKHVLSVIAYDNATGRVSSTSSLTLFMAAPWWEKWWARTAYAALLILAIYAVIRLRTRVYARRQHELELLVEERTSSMREAQVALRRIATTDGLTGLLNRTEAQHRLSAALRQRKAWSVLVVALVDIDHFKRVNDECGHLFGDEVLRVVGRKGLDTFREPEIACRFGGEEFLFVLHDEDGLAIARLEAFQNEVRATQVSRHERTRRVTLSIGIARPEPGEGWEGVVGRADEALYLAKSGGRDTMVVLGAEEARSAATPAE